MKRVRAALNSTYATNIRIALVCSLRIASFHRRIRIIADRFKSMAFVSVDHKQVIDTN